MTFSCPDGWVAGRAHGPRLAAGVHAHRRAGQALIVLRWRKKGIDKKGGRPPTVPATDLLACVLAAIDWPASKYPRNTVGTGWGQPATGPDVRSELFHGPQDQRQQGHAHDDAVESFLPVARVRSE